MLTADKKIERRKFRLKQKKCSHEYPEPKEHRFKNGIVHLRSKCLLCSNIRYFPRNKKKTRLKNLFVNKTARKLFSAMDACEKESFLAHERYGDSFYASLEWIQLRYKVFLQYGRTCMCCGTTSGPIHVDHIKPRSKYPNLSLEFENLQVLCKPCNFGKSNIDETDWRPKQLTG